MSNNYATRLDIYKLRTTMWNPVVSRAHNPIAVFPFTSSSSTSAEVELMLHGTVSYTLNDGRKCEDVEWAARGILVDAAGETRWKRYQVYMVRILRSTDYQAQQWVID